MTNLSEMALPRGMSSSRYNLMKDFYSPCLSRAIRFDRAAGYFSSAILALAPVAYSDFFQRGGRIRLVTSTHLSQQDAEAVKGPAPFQPDELLSALQGLSDAKSKSIGLLARILASLLSSGVVELKFVEPKSGRGVFHDKYGIFYDSDGGAVSFIGSANETAFAWSGLHNHEQIEIFRTSEPTDLSRISDHEDSFKIIWADQLDGYKVFSSAEFESKLLKLIPPEPIEDLLTELRLKHAKQSVKPSKECSALYTLRDYQEQALVNWEQANRRGVISFATGGGKTLTAIEAIRRWVESGPVLVMLPSTLLLEQWRDEIRSWLPDVSLLQVGGGNSKSRWIKELHRFSQPGSLGKRLILSTYASASTPEFKEGLSHGMHLMVVGDEVHRFGAQDTRQIATWLNSGATLGLSATPIRDRDPEGTSAIFNFFGELVEPIYSLEDAIQDQILVPYDYSIELAPLSEDEEEEWLQITHRISRELAMNDGKVTELAKRLMIKRARISKRAKSKSTIASEIIRTNYSIGDRWLVYCESVSHMDEVGQAIRLALPQSVTVMEFHSKNKEEHRRVISFFETRGGIVLAIKCLDEGIDIPIINRAIILSSSTNPREYIQRRGRVLRRHPNKTSAQIWDLITVDTSKNPIASSEVERSHEFARGSRTESTAFSLDLLSDRAAKVEGSVFDFD
jgi:superfamily II DNA or RNA helicase